jgi:hypothetical protein
MFMRVCAHRDHAFLPGTDGGLLAASQQVRSSLPGGAATVCEQGLAPAATRASPPCDASADSRVEHRGVGPTLAPAAIDRADGTGRMAAGEAIVGLDREARVRAEAREAVLSYGLAGRETLEQPAVRRRAGGIRRGIPMEKQRVRFWQGVSLTLALVLVVVVGDALFSVTAQSNQKPRFAEIDVERINIIEADGTVKLVIANREREPDQVREGQPRPRAADNKSPGITFFDDAGDEAGGLKVRGDRRAGPAARRHLFFDQHRGDQVVGLVSDETEKDVLPE